MAQCRFHYLDISVDIEPVVLAGQHDAAVPHESHVETLGVLHLALQGSDQLDRTKMVSISAKKDQDHARSVVPGRPD